MLNIDRYFDYMASTPMDKEVVAAMEPYFDYVGNPHSHHKFGQRGSQAIALAQQQVANCIGAQSPKEIIFTSGATEANNLAIKGVAEFYQHLGKHIITTKTEHSSVSNTIDSLLSADFRVSYVKLDQDGIVDLADLRSKITSETILISIMHVNSEIGVIQPLQEIGRIANEHGILLHTDAAQAVGKIPLNVKKMQLSLASFSGHKAYGPQGIGCLYVNSSPKVRLNPLFAGGGQQYGLRSGTQPVQLIVGLGKAFDLAHDGQHQDYQHAKKLQNRLIEALSFIDNVDIHGSLEYRVPHNLNLTFKNVDIDALLLAMDDFALSTASACVTTKQQGSKVVANIGKDIQSARHTLRISIGRFTTDMAMDDFITMLLAKVSWLRSIAGA